MILLIIKDHATFIAPDVIKLPSHVFHVYGCYLLPMRNINLKLFTQMHLKLQTKRFTHFQKMVLVPLLDGL